MDCYIRRMRETILSLFLALRSFTIRRASLKVPKISTFPEERFLTTLMQFSTGQLTTQAIHNLHTFFSTLISPGYAIHTRALSGQAVTHCWHKTPLHFSLSITISPFTKVFRKHLLSPNEQTFYFYSEHVFGIS